MNDLRASELISQSLAGKLNAQDSAALQQYLQQHPPAQALAELSEVIQQALRNSQVPSSADAAEPTEAGSDESLPTDSVRRLNPVAKERMKRTVSQAYRAGESSAAASPLRVAQTETIYYTGSPEGQRPATDPQQPEVDGTLTTPMRPVSATAGDSWPATSATAPADSDDPQRLGEHGSEGFGATRNAHSRFTLLRRLGQGGLGTVWLARDETLRRQVALKELKPGLASSQQVLQRFQREAEITAHLEHPNVVPLYLSGIHPDSGLPFYAMRFLGKQTLADAIQEYHARRHISSADPIYLHRLLNVFLDVCQAIAFAHSRGVIHRDLKPENVALDNFGQVLVLDWGLAKLDSDGELATRLALSGLAEINEPSETLDGDVLGTPLYMAPEQASGDMHLADERTDVYGLGAILFAILTGSAPHENSNRTGSGRVQLKQMLSSIVQSDAPRPRDINPSVPRDLEAICVQAMSKERFARHASAQELAADVESWIAGRHRLQARYDAMRMTGRDLKSRLCVQIRQLAVTAQFLAELPPIQGILACMNGEPQSQDEWRDRLTKIFMALARARKNLSGLSYAHIHSDRIHEIIRIERSRYDADNIRALPASRLRNGAVSTFHKMTLEQFPGECYLDFDLTTAGSIRLAAGVPVFDTRSDELFGLVLAEAEIGNLAKPEIAATESQDIVYLIDDKDRLLFVNRAEQSEPLAPADSLISRWPEIVRGLAEQGEYLDADREFYATRLLLPHNQNAIRIVLQVVN